MEPFAKTDAAHAQAVPLEVRPLTTSLTRGNESAPTKWNFVRAKETSVDQSYDILSHALRSGPVGKLISRVGADAQVAHADAGAAIEHIDIARQIDARCDALMQAASVAISQALHARTPAERDEWLRVSAERVCQAQELDRIEEEHWGESAPSRIVTARTATLRIVERTETALTRKTGA